MSSPTVDHSAENATNLAEASASSSRNAISVANQEGGHDGEFVWIRPFPNPLRQPLRAIAWIAQILSGVASLLVLLTIAAAIPVVNLLVLGYLLEAESQVARTGKVRHALPLLPAAMRIGSIVVGTLLSLVPVMLLANVAADARLIAPQAAATRFWTAALAVVSTMIAIHIVLAWSRGGSLGCFVRPLKNVRWLRESFRSGDYLSRANRDACRFLSALRPWHHFWLGVRGFLGTWVWLTLPSAMYGVEWHSSSTWCRLITVAAGACLVPVLAWVPFLQVRLAVENRWSAMFDVQRIRELFRHAPLSWLLAATALYSLSIPLFLYSLQFRMHLPLDLRIGWDFSFISLVCTLPARAALGWAYHRSTVRGLAWFGWTWISRLVLTGALVLYVWLLFHTPLTHEFHPLQMEHHALVLPIPL